MSERTLHRLFDESGQTVTELIRSGRLDGILADLQSPASAGDAISRIAARWGIHDMPHLTRAFRARHGCRRPRPGSAAAPARRTKGERRG
jgi:AraC-like DNA-binding protein